MCIKEHTIDYYDISESRDHIKHMTEYCLQVHKFDSDSSLFRYPVNKKCTPYRKSIKYYNAVNLIDFLESLCNAIDGINGVAEQREDYFSEMRAEYSSYC